MTPTRRLGLAAAVLALTAACAAQPTVTLVPATTAPTPAVLATLAGLTVAVEDTGYNRNDWGGWTSVGRCDTRETVLAQQGDGEVVDDQCRPACPAALRRPCWTSPYDGRPTADPAELDIDHLVALAEAEQSGARNWPPEMRHRFANGTTNLIAVTAAVNRAKGDRDPAQWQPAKWRCGYAARWVRVKAAWSLSVDAAERDALGGMLRGCTEEETS